MDDFEDEMPVLTNEYNQKIRPYIDLVDSLREFGLDQDINLPAVAVIGDQSAGKSSVLESISGISLPKATGMVTRCPLIIRMKQAPFSEKRNCNISYKRRDGSIHSLKIDDKERVAAEIENAQNQLAGTEKNISHEPITLDIRSPDVPDLTLIDLPGLIKNPLPNQPENIGQQIQDLIKEVISKQETIILAVVPANVDIATTESLRIAREHDPNGERTIGVITKPDLIDKGTEPTLVSTINNEVVPLRKGFVAVKCRSQHMVTSKVDIQEGHRDETEFFKSTPHFRSVDERKLGIKNLCSKLSEELVHQIKKCVPSIRHQVMEKKYETQARLGNLGKGIPEDLAEKIRILVDLINNFNKDIQEIFEGNNHSGEATAQYQLFNWARKCFKKLYDDMIERIPEFDDSLIKRLLEDIDKYRGIDLPGFTTYLVVRNLVREITRTYHQPAHECLHQLHQIVGTIIEKVIDTNFERFPGLNNMIKHSSGKRKEGATELCKERIDEIFEMEDLVYTQDRNFKYDLAVIQKAENEKVKELMHEENILALENIVDHRVTNFKGRNESDSTATKKDAAEMYCSLKSYLEVAARRMVDTIPMMINLHLFKKLSDNIRKDAIAMVADGQVHELIREEEEIAEMRTELDQKMIRLEKAEEELLHFA